jgi:DNA transformation protein
MKSAARKAHPARGPLRSMRVSAGFREFVLDQLAGLDGLRARAMFGGVGLYADDVFFGIVAAGELFFKVDDTNRREYEAAGSAPFKPYEDRAMTMPYYNVPLVVLEDAAALGEWAARAVAVARAAKSVKPTKARKREGTATPAKSKAGVRR